ncbi:hypothetical protein QVD17_34191 [Tagetes erecta]|uniref:Uncharacterized protein n=1 Tax=Tagetes erecta TaxID=13708 RepID=A0AAD8K1T1_TARER|nr:hypothetical protein QVD17_34191 [Tagetes erecta]
MGGRICNCQDGTCAGCIFVITLVNHFSPLLKLSLHISTSDIEPQQPLYAITASSPTGRDTGAPLLLTGRRHTSFLIALRHRTFPPFSRLRNKTAEVWSTSSSADVVRRLQMFSYRKNKQHRWVSYYHLLEFKLHYIWIGEPLKEMMQWPINDAP